MLNLGRVNQILIDFNPMETARAETQTRLQFEAGRVSKGNCHKVYDQVIHESTLPHAPVEI